MSVIVARFSSHFKNLFVFVFLLTLLIENSKSDPYFTREKPKNGLIKLLVTDLAFPTNQVKNRVQKDKTLF